MTSYAPRSNHLRKHQHSSYCFRFNVRNYHNTIFNLLHAKNMETQIETIVNQAASLYDVEFIKELQEILKTN